MNTFPWRCVAVLPVLLLLVAGTAPLMIGGQDISGAGGNRSGASLARAVVRPDHAGPYNVGFMYETLKPSTKSYTVQVKLFYPAQAAGQDTAANTAGAPYPTIVHLTGFGGGVESLNGVLTRVASWGFVSAMLEVNWNDWPNCANVSDINDLLDQLESDNATQSHPLHGMMDREAFGIHGYSSGGGLCLVDGTYVGRLKAVCSWASAIDNSYTDVLAATFNKPIQLQAGEYDSTYGPTAWHAYTVFPAPKAYLGITGGTHQGPYDYDAMISFFFRYLYHNTGYDTFLYGTEAMYDASNLTYALNFTLPNGSYFPPNITVSASMTMPVEDQPVDFNLSYDGYLPVGHPKGSFEWDLNGDGQAELGGVDNTTATCEYVRAGVVRPSAWFELGQLRLRMNRTLALTVTNVPPEVHLGGNRTATEDASLNFTADVNDTPSDIGTLQYAWDMGDGTSLPYQAALNTSHTYRNAGNYTVMLSVRDDEGAVSSDSIRLAILDVPPTASAPSNLTVNKDEELVFQGAGNDTPSDLSTLQYRWTFGDGSQRDWAYDPSAVHTYTRSGNFTAVFEVMDDEGAAANSSVAVMVVDQAPVPAISVPRPGTELDKDDETVFQGDASDSITDQPYLQYSWDFGDGNVTDWGPRAAATHTYTRGGNYTAVLRSRDPDGMVGEAPVNITVFDQPPEISIISPVSGQVQEDEKVAFSAEGTDTPSDIDLLDYAWDIDGNSYDGDQFELAFTTEGTHQFQVTVRDTEGKTASASGTLDVVNVAPKLSANIFPDTLFVNESVNFSASGSDTASDKPALEFSWDFGDGTTFVMPSGSHVFTKPGTFAVKVTVADDEGAKKTQSFTITVNARPAPPPPARNTGNDTGQKTGPSTTYVVAGAVAFACIVAGFMLVLRRRRRPGG